MPENLNTLWARLIVEELLRCDVNKFFISPGSRSTPLTAAIANNPGASATICYDERGGAFAALGCARATNRPAAVITTSGTAAANLLPAITEASVDKVPLLLLTADRPPELTDTGANQTLNQPGMFGKFVRWQFDLPCPSPRIGPEMVLTTIDQAVFKCGGFHPGPVHINCRFREPLEPVNSPITTTEKLAKWQASTDPFTTYQQPKAIASPEVVHGLIETINSTDRGMIVAGRLEDSDQQQAVRELAAKLNWPVYADITSGLRLTGCGTSVIRHFDQELLSEQFNSRAAVDTVIHFGGRTTSKRLGQFFDQNRPADYIVVKSDGDRYDPIHAVTQHIQADIADFFAAITDKITASQQRDFTDFYNSKADAAQQIIEAHIAGEQSLTEAFVARQLSASLPDATGLLLSNSMPIRDMDLYSRASDKTIFVAANRGISGIDGVIATAAGFACGLEKPTTVVIGDLAMIHDLNSLSMLSRINQPVIVVVINNHGGGIFDFLPISQHKDVFEDYFVTPHNYEFKGVCQTFGLHYHKATTKDDFADCYNSIAAGGESAVIEVATDRMANLKLRKAMKKAIIEELEK